MLRSAIGAAVVVIVLFTSGCGFSPVYNDGSPINAASLAFEFGIPSSRTEQVVYQELSLRFAMSAAPNTPKLDVTTHSSRGNVFLSKNPGPQELRDVSVTVTAVVTLNGKELFRAVRRATAEYTQDKQVLADRTAASEAEERAAKAAAESLRLVLLARFPYNETYL